MPPDQPRRSIGHPQAEVSGTDQGVVFGGPVTIEALMNSQRGVFPDCDAIAAAVKPVIDGIVDAGVILDDSPEHVRSITYHAPRRSDARRLVVLIKEVVGDSEEMVVSHRCWRR